jgi:hypothetical protein
VRHHGGTADDCARAFAADRPPFPVRPGSPRRRFDINPVAGRARRPLGELTRISLRSIRATACYSLRDANLPPAPGEYARGGVQYDGSWMANAVSASQRGVIWTRISLSLNPGYGLQWATGGAATPVPRGSIDTTIRGVHGRAEWMERTIPSLNNPRTERRSCFRRHTHHPSNLTAGFGQTRWARHR